MSNDNRIDNITVANAATDARTAPVKRGDTLGERLLAVTKTGTFRRIVTGLVGVALIALDKKLGLNMSEADKAEVTGIVIAMILGSNYKEAKLGASPPA